MHTTIRQPRPTGDMPKPRSFSTPSNRVTGHESAPAIVRPIALDRGDSLRIRNGRGTRLRAASGVLWITEENCLADHILLPGGAIDLAQAGTALVLAHRTARIVIEVPAGVAPPRAVELALHSGEPAMPIALASPTTISLSAMGASVAGAAQRAVAAIRAFVETLRLSRDVLYSSAADRAGYGRRESGYGVGDEWTMWRM